MSERGGHEAPRSLEPWLELTGKVVMVTGASSGIGRDICLDLGKAGCRIVAAARRIDRLQSLSHEINSRVGSASSGEPSPEQPRAVAVALDISAGDPAIEAAVNEAWGTFGRIDALINNAGVRGRKHTPLDLDKDEWDEVMATNLTGTWLMSKYVCRKMRDGGVGGSIINISSIAGVDRTNVPGGLAYAASKSAINFITKVMALELGLHKIKVNSICPGIFKSEITRDLMQKDWFDRVAMRTVPLKSYGEVDPAITSLVRYLIHDSSEYVTGNIFLVESGSTLLSFPIISSL